MNGFQDGAFLADVVRKRVPGAVLAADRRIAGSRR